MEIVLEMGYLSTAFQVTKDHGRLARDSIDGQGSTY